MDYETRHVKWYWLFLFIIYSGGVIYLLFSGNPYLYSHHELRALLNDSDISETLTIPAKPDQSASLGAPTFFARYNFERSAVDPLGTPRYKDYQEHQNFSVKLEVENFEVRHIAQDGTGFYLTGNNPWVVRVGLDGETLWRFRMRDLPSDRTPLPVLLDENKAYIAHPQGEVICLNKHDGSIHWVLKMEQEVVTSPFFWENSLILPVKGTKNVRLLLINRATGKVSKNTPTLDLKPGFQVTHIPGGKGILATFDNKVVAIDPAHWKIAWSQTLPDPIVGPVTAVENSIFVSSMGGKVVRLDSGRKGRLDWETDIERTPAVAPSYIPVAHRLAVLDTNGVLVTIDGKTGKILWKFNTENKNPLLEPWSVRLSGKHIEEFKMDWAHKGWTVWSPCYQRRFCMYTPNKGQMIERVLLTGQPLVLPLQVDRRWVFFGQKKPQEYVISHVLEESEIKRLKAASAAPTVSTNSTAPATPPSTP